MIVQISAWSILNVNHNRFFCKINIEEEILISGCKINIVVYMSRYSVYMPYYKCFKERIVCVFTTITLAIYF